MLPQLKVYKIDYSWIIKNYLDVSLWDKSWNLLIYKEHQFQLKLNKIYTQTKRIEFQISKNGYYHTEEITYDMTNTSIDILKQQINGALFRVIEHYECYLLQQTEEYNAILEACDQERDRLRDIATDFLDDEGVTNVDIREAYIDKFIDTNEQLYSKAGEYLQNAKYTLLPDLYITFCKIINDKERLHKVMANIGDRLTIKELMTEVNAFLENMETDEYREEMENELEGI